jgi:hypothetical protein
MVRFFESLSGEATIDPVVELFFLRRDHVLIKTLDLDLPGKRVI